MQWLRPRFTVRRMMVAVAVAAVVLSAWLYHVENENVSRSLTGIQLRALGESDAAHRRRAVENLSSVDADDLGRVVSALTVALRDDDWQVRRAAARSLAASIRQRVGARKGAVEEEVDAATRSLIRAFDDPRPEVRLEAVEAVGILHDTITIPPSVPAGRSLTVTIGTKDGRAVAPLVRAMRDPDSRIRAAAIRSLARAGPPSGAAPDPVLEALEHDPDDRVRAAAVGALASGWPDPDRLYPLFLRRLKEASSLEERSAIGWSLGGLPAPPIESLPALIGALDPDNFALGKNIPAALAKLGPAARPSLPALLRAARRELAAPPGSFPTLWAALAITTIDRHSAEAQSLLEPLVTLLRESPENSTRQQAAIVLDNYGPASAAAVPSLRKALGSPNLDVRQRAVYLLGHIGPPARAAREDLAALARDDPDFYVRRGAADALKAIDAE